MTESTFDFMLPGVQLEDFQPLKLDGPIDLDAYRAAVPEDALLRGMFFRSVIDELEAAGKMTAETSRERELLEANHIAFKNYPALDFVDLVALAADRLHPELGTKGGIAEVSKLAYAAYQQSMIGRVLLAAAGTSPRMVTGLLPRMYSSISTMRGSIILSDAAATCFRLEHCPIFVDVYQPSGIGAMMDAIGRPSTITVARRGPMAADILIRW